MPNNDEQTPSENGGPITEREGVGEQLVVPSPRLLEILVCPLTRSTLEISKDRTELISRQAHLAYPIRDGIPLLTRETARELSEEELRSL